MLLRSTLLAFFAIYLSSCSETADTSKIPYLMSVQGPIAPKDLGFTLPHEHVMVDFGGAAIASPDRYDAETVFQAVLPYLQEAKDAGLRSLIDCTPPYIGRDVQLLKRFSKQLGIHILTPTGYYGAAKDKYVPAHAYSESADQLAARWIAEWENGIEGTDIRPGFIKTAVDKGPVSEIDRKLFQAGARAHLATGLTLATHTGGNPEAVATQLEILAKEGVSPKAWIWVHAQNVSRFEQLLPALEAGAWLGLEGLRRSSLQKHVFDKQLNLVVRAKEAGYIKQLLVSHDAGWYQAGAPNGAMEKFGPFTLIMDKFIPALKKKGFTQAEIDQIFIQNPAEAFAVRIREKE